MYCSWPCRRTAPKELFCRPIRQWDVKISDIGQLCLALNLFSLWDLGLHADGHLGLLSGLIHSQALLHSWTWDSSGAVTIVALWDLYWKNCDMPTVSPWNRHHQLERFHWSLPNLQKTLHFNIEWIMICCMDHVLISYPLVYSIICFSITWYVWSSCHARNTNITMDPAWQSWKDIKDEAPHPEDPEWQKWIYAYPTCPSLRNYTPWNEQFAPENRPSQKENSIPSVDGRNPAPIDRYFISLFTGFYTSQVVSRISSINRTIHFEGLLLLFLGNL